MVANIASSACSMLPLLSLCVFISCMHPDQVGVTQLPAGRVSESGSMNYVQNILECPCYNHSVSWLHSLNLKKNA